jgi:hypothetical protein
MYVPGARGAAVSGDGRHGPIVRVTAETLQTSMRSLEESARQAEELYGITVLRPLINLDDRFDELVGMETRARHFVAAMRLVRQWMLPGDRRPLGTMLKIIPRDAADEITGHLRGAGLLPAEE